MGAQQVLLPTYQATVLQCSRDKHFKDLECIFLFTWLFSSGFWLCVSLSTTDWSRIFIVAEIAILIQAITLFLPALLFAKVHCFWADCWLISAFLIRVLFLLGALKAYGYLNIATDLFLCTDYIFVTRVMQWVNLRLFNTQLKLLLELNASYVDEEAFVAVKQGSVVVEQASARSGKIFNVGMHLEQSSG